MRPWLRLLAAMLALAVPGAAAAQNSVQNPQNPQNPMQSALQGQNKDQPIHIEAATLEVHDKAKTATFSGNVQVVQGDTTMRCRSLVVFYGNDPHVPELVASGMYAVAKNIVDIAGGNSAVILRKRT